MRLIDADALLEAYMKTDRYFMVKYDIEEAPTIELPHGEWKSLYTTIDGFTKSVTCSCCGYERGAGPGCSLDVENLPKFCEGCGADMRTKEGD